MEAVAEAEAERGVGEAAREREPLAREVATGAGVVNMSRVRNGALAEKCNNDGVGIGNAPGSRLQTKIQGQSASQSVLLCSSSSSGQMRESKGFREPQKRVRSQNPRVYGVPGPRVFCGSSQQRQR